MSVLKYKDSLGVWHDIPTIKGDEGVGITNIEKTSTVGKVDTYTITLSNGTTKTFTVTNGNDGAGGTWGSITGTLSNQTDLQDALDGKVDKVTGKGLSTNDYDATAKGKVDAIPANPKYTDTVYDDTAITGRVSTIEGKEAGWDAKGTYSKPSGGIPSTDMTSDVQTSLGKADSALQSHQDISGKQDKITASGLLKGDGSGGISAAVAGTDYESAGTAATKLNRSDNVNAANTSYGTAMARAIYAGTSDMTAGTTALTSGTIYLVYE